MLKLVIIIFSGLMVFVFVLAFIRLKQKRKAIKIGGPTSQYKVKNHDLENKQIEPINQKEQYYKNEVDQILKIKALLNNLEKELKKISNSKYTVEIISQINSIINNFESPLLVTVLGEFSSGKSTFINALLEESILAMKVRPTTAAITKIQYAPKRKLKVYYRNGNTKEHDIRDLHTVTVENFVNEKNILDDIAFVQIELEKEFLKVIDLADTPGFNSNCERHSEITSEFIKHSDVVFWLFDANQLEKKTTFALIQKHCRFSKPVGIINKIDHIIENETEADAEKYLAELMNLITPYTESVFAISAKYALLQNTYHQSGIERVKQYFSNTIIPNAFETKKFIILNKLVAIIIDINTARDSILNLTSDKKVILDKFSEQVKKYNLDRSNYLKSIDNWNKDIKRGNNEFMVKHIERYLLVEGVNLLIAKKSKTLLSTFDELTKEDNRLSKIYEEIALNRNLLEIEYSKWLNAFNEYDNKLGKNIVDSVWNFFTGEDLTEEKILLNNKSYNYNQHELEFNKTVDNYNERLKIMNRNWSHLSDSTVDFLNNIVKIRMEEQINSINKQYEMIYLQESNIKKLEIEYEVLYNDLKIFDDGILQILSSLLEIIESNNRTLIENKIKNYASLMNNIKKHCDGYINLDWKELYSRNKISTIVAGFTVESKVVNKDNYQNNLNKKTKQV